MTAPQSPPPLADRLHAALLLLGRSLRQGRDTPGPSRLLALGCLTREGPLTAARLADRLRIQPQSLTRLLAALEADGLIARTPDPVDRRALRLAPTDQGRDMLEQELRLRRDRLAEAMLALSATEQDLLAEACGLLDRLAVAIAESAHD